MGFKIIMLLFYFYQTLRDLNPTASLFNLFSFSSLVTTTPHSSEPAIYLLFFVELRILNMLLFSLHTATVGDITTCPSLYLASCRQRVQSFRHTHTPGKHILSCFTNHGVISFKKLVSPGTINMVQKLRDRVFNYDVYIII